MSRDRGALALVLHTHMPYVEGFGTWPFGEEWLFDAVIRSYAPISAFAERLTMTVTPVLADQLEAVDPYVAPVRVTPGQGVLPGNLREQIRSNGPTVALPGQSAF